MPEDFFDIGPNLPAELKDKTDFFQDLPIFVKLGLGDVKALKKDDQVSAEGLS